MLSPTNEKGFSIPPKTKLTYENFDSVTETASSRVFEATARNFSRERHTIRVLDSTKAFVANNFDVALTLFIQELLHLQNRCPGSVLINSLEINSILKQAACAIHPCGLLSAAAQPNDDQEFTNLKNPKVIERLLDGVMSDVEFLSRDLQMKNIKALVNPDNIYHFKKSGAFFLSNWIKNFENGGSQEPENLLPQSLLPGELIKLTSQNLAEEIKALAFALLTMKKVGLKQLIALQSMPDLRVKVYNAEVQEVIEEGFHDLQEPKELAERLRKLVEKMFSRDLNSLPNLDEFNIKKEDDTQIQGLIIKETKGKTSTLQQISPKTEELKLNELSDANQTLEQQQPKPQQIKSVIDEYRLNKQEIGSRLFKLLSPLFAKGTKLTTLVLDNVNPIGDAGTWVLSKNSTWTNLTTLKLYNNLIGTSGAIALSENSSWTNLTTLDLGVNPSIGAEGASALSKNRTWTNLTTLDLQSNSIDAKGASALSKNSTWMNLTTLNLACNSIGAEGAKAFSYNSIWTNLSTLNLMFNSIGAEGASALSGNRTWTNLTTLDLGHNSIGDQGASALSKNSTWMNLATLNLETNMIGAKGASALSKNRTWTNLTTLDLQRNSIGSEGTSALSNNSTWTNLTTLKLYNHLIFSIKNKNGAEGAIALSKNSTWTNLTTLSLQYHSIGAEGAIALSKNSTWMNLTILSLESNSIGSEGASALSKNSIWTNLTTLDLARNSIGDQGASALSQNSTWTNLTNLNLQLNSIGAEGASALSKNSTWMNLTILNLCLNHNFGGEVAIALKKRWPRVQLDW